MCKNRAAFLVGLYLQVGRVDCIYHPFLKIAPVLAPAKVILLDATMARSRSLLSRARILEETFAPEGEWPQFSSVLIEGNPQFQFQLLKGEFCSELRVLRDISAQLWTGQSRTRSWYESGIACGALLNCLPTSWTMYPPCRVTPTETEFRERQESVASLVRNAHKGNVEQVVRLREAIIDLRGDRMDATVHLGDASDCIADSSTGGASRADVRNQYIYEQIVLHEQWGGNLLEQVNDERDRAWPEVKDPSKLREYANNYARRHGLPDLPEGSPGPH